MDRLDISRDVFLKIRALCREGGKTEDQVLRRLLEGAGENDAPPHQPGGTPGDGFTDTTYGIYFPEGSEIFRTYKGRPFSARVVRGRWLLDADGLSYDSLNQLSQGLIDGNENAWMFWFYQGPGGAARRIGELRDPGQVPKRPRRQKVSPARRVFATMDRPQSATAGMPWQPGERPKT